MFSVAYEAVYLVKWLHMNVQVSVVPPSSDAPVVSVSPPHFNAMGCLEHALMEVMKLDVVAKLPNHSFGGGWMGIHATSVASFSWSLCVRHMVRMCIPSKYNGA